MLPIFLENTTQNYFLQNFSETRTVSDDHMKCRLSTNSTNIP